MKKHILFPLLPILLFSLCVSSHAQENEDKNEIYTVKGYRHGPSFFKQHHFPEVEYEAGDSLTWDIYHSADVMYVWMRRWVKEFPNLIDLYEVGQSFEGRPILQMTITNKETGNHTDKPAAFFEGGRHSGEVTSSESALWLAHYVLHNYGQSDEITQLLDTKTLYIRPQNNPDGSNLYLNTAMRNRSSVRPHDNDRDGLLDEDEADDIDGDGVIYTMRWIDPEKGSMVSDLRDETGQLIRRADNEKGIYRTASEGYDNDGDGSYNEDGIGGLDLHRNYPENWRPDRGLDETGRGYTQHGAGAYPLSEPETRAVFTFLMTHPNISVVNSMDTRVPMHLRGPSVDFSENIMFPEDLVLFEHFDSVGMAITKYPWAGDTYNTYNTRYPVSPWSGDSTRPSPLFGHGPDFGYSYYGSIWYGDELWNGGRFKDYDQDGQIDDYDIYQWNLQENDGKQFKPWEKYLHPDLGLVEIGGFHPKFFSQNPPPKHLEPWIKNQALFNLEMARALPQLEWVDIEINATEKSTDSVKYEINLSWTNTGMIPTALKMADQIKIVRKDRISLSVDSDYLEAHPNCIEILSPSGERKQIEKDHLGQNEVAGCTFIARAARKQEIPVKIKVSSTRGGILTKDLRLK